MPDEAISRRDITTKHSREIASAFRLLLYIPLHMTRKPGFSLFPMFIINGGLAWRKFLWRWIPLHLTSPYGLMIFIQLGDCVAFSWKDKPGCSIRSQT
jgi:hypothetical protein